jgi:hypothetical protein
MQSMRRFFCAWMDFKTGHTIQILCVGADRRGRPRSPIAIEYAMNTKRIRVSFIHE